MAKKKKHPAKNLGVQMRTKTKTFAEKVRSKRRIIICPICGEEVKIIRYVRQDSGKLFRDTKVKVCSCNREEIYGSQ